MNEDQVLHGVHCLPLFHSGKGSLRFLVTHLFSPQFSDRVGKKMNMKTMGKNRKFSFRRLQSLLPLCFHSSHESKSL